MSGLFITLEGGEGAGKTTQAKRLASFLEQRGHTVLLTREPGGSPGAEALRNLLLADDVPLSQRAQALGHMAARADHLDSHILPALARGEVVVCDRFHDSTMAYQGYGLAHGDPDVLAFIAGLKTLIAKDPDLTLLLETSIETGRDRMTARGQHPDRYEAQDLDFHRRVAAGFDTIARQEPLRVARIDATPGPDEVAHAIAGVVEQRLAG